MTRACVESFMNRPQPYDAHNLILPASLRPDSPADRDHSCLPERGALAGLGAGGRGGWVTQVPTWTPTASTVPQLPYTP